jgi:Cytochrome P460
MLRISKKHMRAAATSAAVLAALGGIARAAQDRFSVAVPEGISFSEFKGYETWQMVSVSQHTGIIDVILGNPVTIAAYKSGIPANGKPFPDGAKMVKIHWNSKKYSDAFPVQAPDTLHDIDTMVRDSKRFTQPDHWGFSQFNYDNASETFTPLGKGPNCGTACHQAAAARDFVFTEYPAR